jgi:plasmid stabilization system protein ParE
MKTFAVIFHPEAETDIRSSYQWGRGVWGEQKAKSWARELHRAIKTRLTSLPVSCPLAPESDDLGIPIRQLIVQRYRVLFIVEKKTVTILHVRGPHRAEIQPCEADDG